MSQNPAESVTSAYFHQKLDGMERWVKHKCGKDLIIRAKSWENEQNQLMVGTMFFNTLDRERSEKNRLKKCPQCFGKLTEYLDPHSVRENYLPHNETVSAFYTIQNKVA